MGKGTLPGIASPQTGFIYIIAGYNATLGGTLNTYSPASAGTTFYPTFPATTIALGVRKLSIDTAGNLYIPDSGANVIWFVDAVTGNMHGFWLEICGVQPPRQRQSDARRPSMLWARRRCPGPSWGSMYTSTGDPGKQQWTTKATCTLHGRRRRSHRLHRPACARCFRG